MQITGVELVGSTAKLEFQQTPEALEVKLPTHSSGKYGYALRISSTQ
jgi:hypothetical protein